MKYGTQNTGIENMRYDFMPVGSIVPFASDIIPLGWLLCDGAPIERNRYPELYDLIGDKLPDHRGMFLRGNDNGRGIDAGRVLGSEQDWSITEHKHETINGSDLDTISISDVYSNIDTTRENIITTSPEPGIHKTRNPIGAPSASTFRTFSAGTVNGSCFDSDYRLIGTESRPKNNSVNYIIKALHIANPSMEYQVADGLNHKIETNLIEMREAELNNTGVYIGYNGIKYIQDTGDKVAGKLYYDKLRSELFYCKANTSATVNSDTYFTDYSNYANGNKLQNLELVTENKGISNSMDMVASLSIYGKMAIITGCAYAGTSTRTFAVSGSHEMPTPKKQITTTWSSLHDSMFLIQLTLNKDKTFSVTKADTTGTKSGIFNFSLVYEIE